MKKAFRVLLTVVLVFMFAGISVFADGDKVEISFCVGDETLLINGAEVTVEKPYVVGEGVTLVPLRVITEAFGAKVEWIESTKSIHLSYPDVEIVLQIDNPVAEVNKMAETLLSPPELTENGFTMVPLRFISETFGAEVSYDDVTRRITVVKDKAGEGSIVEGAIDSEKIGDSYYKWSMENPKSMTMAERSFDGTYTLFENDEANYLDITIQYLDEEFDFERDFVEWKNSLSGYTLVKADKDTSSSKVKSMHFQAKDKNSFINIRNFVADGKYFLVYSEVSNEDASVKDEIIRIMDTFELSFNASDAHDLSNAKNGYRTYTSEGLKYSIAIPDNFFQASDENVENKVIFNVIDADDFYSSIHFAVYSVSSVGNAQELANQDFEYNKKVSNPDITAFSNQVTSKEYKGTLAYEYTEDTRLTSGKVYRRDVFFQLGDYVYNVTIDLKNTDGKAAAKADYIINSIKTEELDSEEVGILMRPEFEDEGTFTVKGDNWSLTVPNSYVEAENTGSSVVLVGNNSVFFMQVLSADGMSQSDILPLMNQYQQNLNADANVKILTSAKLTTIGKKQYGDLVFKSTKDGVTSYGRQLMCIQNNKVFAITLSYPEQVYSEYNSNLNEEIIKSLKTN